MKQTKRFICAALAILLILSMAACGGSDRDTRTPDAPAETEAAKTESPAEKAPAAAAPATEAPKAEDPPKEPDPTEPPKPDISAFVGSWKYDAKPFYLLIADSAEWTLVNLYGNDAAKGDISVDGDDLVLNQGGIPFSTVHRIVGGLSDGEGNTLTATDELLLLPTANDPLTETISFSGDYAAVTVNYPKTMTANARSDFEYGLSFNAVLENGTDDYFSNILIAFLGINGYDPYMTQGAATAQPYMKDMLDKMAASVYGSKLIQCFASDFHDCGTYYSMIGYLWLDSSIFTPSPSQPVRGCMEVRYYGPTGRALVAMTVAMENRIKTYFDLCTNMLDSCNYDSMWSTAPKARPAQPAQPAKSIGSDSGDYGTPYYWYDEDGDVWYWNGSYNEFIGFGDDYYIDDDGNYYESNDAGWNPDPDDYDYYDDYDPWSDPGDTWDDWSDPGDTWDDWSDPGDTWDW